MADPRHSDGGLPRFPHNTVRALLGSMVFRLIYASVNEQITHKGMKKYEEYESPEMEIVEMESGVAVLMASFTGENINNWEDM